MKHSFHALLASLALGAGLACAQPASPAPTHTPTPLPSVSLPAELERVLRDYEKAWMAKDATGLAALFVRDGFALPNGSAPVQGAAELQAYYQANAGTPLALRALAFGTAGDLGYILGGYAVEKGAPDVGKFTLVLRRGPDGRWRIVSDMDNPNPSRKRPPVSPTPGAPAQPTQKPA